LDKKTGLAFSGLALDQIHKQLIGSIKGDGGIIRLTEDHAALQRFMVTRPELARIIESLKILPKVVIISTTSNIQSFLTLLDKM